MINASVVFAVFLLIFVIVGAMRGWQREVVAAAAIVLALFAMQSLNGVDRLTSLVSAAPAAAADPSSQLSAADRVKVNRFFVLVAPFLLLTFFGYLGPTLTRQLSGGRFGDRARASVQGSLIGMFFGAINGWLVISTIARFAFNQGLLPDQGQCPATGPALFLPPAGGWSKLIFVESSAYVLLTGMPLIIALVVLFVFVIVAFV